MPILSLAVLALALGYAALRNAGVSPADFDVSLLAIGLITILHFLMRPQQSGRLLSRATCCLLAVVFGIACFQLVPLPLWLVGILSPARAELLRALGPVAAVPGSATLSALPSASRDMLMEMTGRLLVFLLILDLTRHFEDRPWVTALPLLAMALAEACLGLSQAQGGAATTSGTYASRDHYAGLLEMCLPFAILYGIAILRRNRSRSEPMTGAILQACCLLGVGLVIFLAIVMSLSRMAFVSTMAALFVVGSISLGARQTGGKRWAVVAAMVLLVVVAFAALPSDVLVGRFGDLKSEGVSTNTRTLIWRETGGLIRAYPLFGCGLGSYVSCFQRYKVVAPMLTIDYAHNDFLQYWAELGTIGFLAGLLFFLRLFIEALPAATGEHGRDRRYLAQACLGALTAIGMHSFADFNMYVPANGLVLAWIAGITAACGSDAIAVRKRRRRHKSHSAPDDISDRSDPARVDYTGFRSRAGGGSM